MTMALPLQCNVGLKQLSMVHMKKDAKSIVLPGVAAVIGLISLEVTPRTILAGGIFAPLLEETIRAGMAGFRRPFRLRTWTGTKTPTKAKNRSQTLNKRKS